METKGLIKIIILLLLCLVIHTLTSNAQTVFNKDSKITVVRNTTITVKGSVENSGTIVNDGHLQVAGAWVNAGTYESGEGAVTFNSNSATVPQIIHHNGQRFFRLALSGGTKKTILSDLVVGSEIQFDNGIVEAAGTSKIIFDPGVLVSGASDISHVHGPVFHRGSGHKLYPIGNGLAYLPVELTNVTDPSALIGISSFESGNMTLSKTPSLRSISDKRYWHIEVDAGSLDNSRVILPLRGEAWIHDPEKVVVVQSSSPAEDFESIGKSVLTGQGETGRIVSGARVTMPFVALATTAAELVVYNAVSPNGDGFNDFLRIANIENYVPNRLSVFNRWGDKIFEIDNYDNEERVFRGRSNIYGDREIETGTYFYVLDLPAGESLRGYIAVKK